jgi:hypothetical protein
VTAQGRTFEPMADAEQRARHFEARADAAEARLALIRQKLRALEAIPPGNAYEREAAMSELHVAIEGEP